MEHKRLIDRENMLAKHLDYVLKSHKMATNNCQNDKSQNKTQDNINQTHEDKSLSAA